MLHNEARHIEYAGLLSFWAVLRRLWQYRTDILPLILCAGVTETFRLTASRRRRCGATMADAVQGQSRRLRLAVKRLNSCRSQYNVQPQAPVLRPARSALRGHTIRVWCGSSGWAINEKSQFMKTVRFHAPGIPDQVLQVAETQKPKPAFGEVLVRMLAAPVNPSDLMFVRGQYTVAAQCPATPGFEGVGIVEESGGGLRGRLFRGKRVVVLNRRGGNWAEYAVVPADQVIPVSRSLSLEQAATFFVNPATAWVMTREVLQVPRGAWLLQTAAGSSLGRMIIRLGQHFGYKTFNVVRREAQANELRELGADHVEVFDGSESDTERFQRHVADVVGPFGLAYAVDAVGGSTGSAVIQSLGARGRMLAFGTLSGKPLQFSSRTLMTVGSQVEGFWLGNFMLRKSLLFKLLLVRRLTKLIQSGVLSSEIAASYGLDEIREAVRSAEDSRRPGKTLLRLADK